ncbi:MAG: hypothetical protein WC527_07035 [Candidatus Margulisiibacteriota bacterium]
MKVSRATNSIRLCARIALSDMRIALCQGNRNGSAAIIGGPTFLPIACTNIRQLAFQYTNGFLSTPKDQSRVVVSTPWEVMPHTRIIRMIEFPNGSTSEMVDLAAELEEKADQVFEKKEIRIIDDNKAQAWFAASPSGCLSGTPHTRFAVINIADIIRYSCFVKSNGRVHNEAVTLDAGKFEDLGKTPETHAEQIANILSKILMFERDPNNYALVITGEHAFRDKNGFLKAAMLLRETYGVNNPLFLPVTNPIHSSLLGCYYYLMDWEAR